MYACMYCMLYVCTYTHMHLCKHAYVCGGNAQIRTLVSKLALVPFLCIRRKLQSGSSFEGGDINETDSVRIFCSANFLFLVFVYTHTNMHTCTHINISKEREREREREREMLMYFCANICRKISTYHRIFFFH